jgi:hypothetical protein
MKWSIKAMGEVRTRSRTEVVEREFIVYAENRLKAVQLFQWTGIKLSSKATIEPTVEVETNLYENRKAPGA